MTSLKQGSVHDFWGYSKRPLDVMFRPKSIAVIGATERENSVGRTIMQNLMSSPFGGTIYPVNRKRKSVLGIRAYTTLEEIPDDIELAIIVIRAEFVPRIVRECVAKGVKGAIIISAGFKEIGEDGVALEQDILTEARRGNMRIIGPNCLGVMSPQTGLNATFARGMAQKGSVAFVSQSGAMCTAILDWSKTENVGFSHFVSIGSMLDVDWGDLIHFLGSDSRTKSIVIYMESIGNARSFLSAAREVALTKPIIVIKPGRTEAAAQAAASHTGSLTGSDEVLDAAFRRCGVLRVDRISDLFYMAELLAKQPRTEGPNLTIVTNAGGPGVLSTDALIGSRGQLTELSAETKTALNELLPPHWSHANPIDILGDATPETYQKVIEIAAKDSNSDGLLVVLSPQAMTDPTQSARDIAQSGDKIAFGKPILASWMGGSDVAEGEDILNQAGIPTYSYPDTAARMFSYMWQYTKNLNSLYETPRLGVEFDPDRTQVQTMIEAALAEKRTILTEYESKAVMAAYGISTVQTFLADSAEKAEQLADQIGYPTVVKLNSNTITHKTDVGGVQLNLADGAAVREAFALIEKNVSEKYTHSDFEGVTVQPMLDLSESYELILGSSLDAQFGPVLLFGAGGVLVEVFKDRALGLPPLNTNIARRIMRRTKIYEALQGIRGRKSVDLAALEALMVNFSYLVVEQPWIKEIDINPLLVSAENIIALDARIILHEADSTQLPRTAIRPYPTQYEKQWVTKQGLGVEIRPIRPEDEPLIVEFHKTVSDESVYNRYFNAIQFTRRVAHNRLIRVCHIDYDREMALVVTQALGDGAKQIIAAGRLSRAAGSDEAEFSLLISDAYQRQGIGTELLRNLIAIGRNEKLARIVAYILPSNRGMQVVSKKLGFKLRYEMDLVTAVLTLDEPTA